MKIKQILSLMLLSIVISYSSIAQTKFYDFKVNDIDGNSFNFSSLQGKKVMIVNVASKCHYTPQYEQLEAVYQKYKNSNFVIIAFPANNFLHQEPGTDKEIKRFCKMNYGVTFPVMSKISVKGKDINEIYKWLTDKKLNGVMSSKVKWNFQKYLIDENGNLIKFYSPSVLPDNNEIINWIENK